MPDLDELQQHWAAEDRKLDTIIALNLRILTAANLNRVRSPLRRLAWLLAIEAAVQLAVVVALGAFCFNNAATIRFAMPGAALDVVAIGILIALIRQIVLIRQIDYLQSLAVIQARLGALRVLRIRHTQVVFLIAALIWTPLLIVAFKGFWGLDAYHVLGPAFLSVQLLFGAAVIPLAIWLSKTFNNRMSRSPIVQRIMKDIAGYDLNAATDALAELAEFEREPPGN